jgi:dCTP deaminase
VVDNDFVALYQFKFVNLKKRVVNLLGEIPKKIHLKNKEEIKQYLEDFDEKLLQIENTISYQAEERDEDVGGTSLDSRIRNIKYILMQFEYIIHNPIKNFNTLHYFIQEFLSRIKKRCNIFETTYSIHEFLKTENLYKALLKKIGLFSGKEKFKDHKSILMEKKDQLFLLKIPKHIIENFLYWSLIGHEIIHINFFQEFKQFSEKFWKELEKNEYPNFSTFQRLSFWTEEFLCDGLAYLIVGDLFYIMLEERLEDEQTKDMDSQSHPEIKLRKIFLKCVEKDDFEEFFKKMEEDINRKYYNTDDKIFTSYRSVFSELWTALNESITRREKFEIGFEVPILGKIKDEDEKREETAKLVKVFLNPVIEKYDIFSLFDKFYYILKGNQDVIHDFLEKKKMKNPIRTLEAFQVDLFRRGFINKWFKDGIINFKKDKYEDYEPFKIEKAAQSAEKPTFNTFLMEKSYQWLIYKESDQKLVISPILDESEQFQPTHIDLRLDTIFRVYNKTLKESINAKVTDSEEIYSSIRDIPLNGEIVLHPGELVLGQTFEYIKLPDKVIGFLDGRSSLGRMGIIVHATASSVDPGFEGHLTFEFYNIGEMPVILYPLMRIGRISFYYTDKSVEKYRGKFKLSFIPSISRLYDDKDLKAIFQIRQDQFD